MSVYQRPGRKGWEYNVTVKRSGKVIARERRAGYRTRGDALGAEAEARTRLAASEKTGPTTTRTFAELAQEVLVLHAAVHNKHSERKSKKRIFELHLVPAFGDLELADIDQRSIAKLKADKLGAGLSAKTLNNLLTVLGKSLSLAVEWGYLKVAPKVGFLRVKKPEIDFLTFDEAPRLLDGADEGAWRAMILTGLRAGLRQSELLELRWNDVDLVAGVLRVRRAIYDGKIDTPKGGRARDVPLSDELVAALRLLPSRFAGGLVWPAKGGSNLTKGECKWPLWRACKRAGLRRIGWHVLRHTFASHLVMRGVALKAVQELLGHASIEMTMRYAHLAPGVTRDAVRLLDGQDHQRTTKSAI